MNLKVLRTQFQHLLKGKVIIVFFCHCTFLSNTYAVSMITLWQQKRKMGWRLFWFRVVEGKDKNYGNRWTQEKNLKKLGTYWPETLSLKHHVWYLKWLPYTRNDFQTPGHMLCATRKYSWAGPSDHAFAIKLAL